jgi:hypothetical protein
VERGGGLNVEERGGARLRTVFCAVFALGIGMTILYPPSPPTVFSKKNLKKF